MKNKFTTIEYCILRELTLYPMNADDFLSQLSQQLSATSPWEWVAVIFGVIQVLFAWKNNVLLYPAGIISTVFSIYLLASVQLYAESFLNVYYLVMSIYGWVYWLGKKSKQELPVTKANHQQLFIASAIVLFGWAILYFILRQYTNSDVPAWDAIVSSAAWAGMWLLAKRKLENWIFLNISNIVAIPLQFHKNIPLYAMLTTVLFVVAIFGFYNWKKIMKMQTAR
ncbi:MAG TPA: nicotinamide riboside transporter PnuC [Flavipsychrobacter sp.]|nr:nicotinamide riboside transporter PnuC [Flavipsychrobacter sp.]